MTALAALRIEQAVDGVIKLTDVPNGATALIPELLHPDPHPSDQIAISISNMQIGERQPVGELIDGFYRHNISRQHLLNNLGQNREFYYTIWSRGFNPVRSDIATYSIEHSS